MKRYEEEMKQRQAELLRQNQAVEDEHRIEIAKLEVKLRLRNIQKDDKRSLSTVVGQTQMLFFVKNQGRSIGLFLKLLSQLLPNFFDQNFVIVC